MSSPLAVRKKLSVFAFIVFGLFVLALGAAIFYLRRPVLETAQVQGASAEAKAYLPDLRLSDVSMQATENFMKQQVIEVQGKISNNGPRTLGTIDVYCLFYGTDGRELHRERLPILHSKGAPLGPGETRPFRLPFDALPDGWNQAMPKMVIAQITFAR